MVSIRAYIMLSLFSVASIVLASYKGEEVLIQGVVSTAFLAVSLALLLKPKLELKPTNLPPLCGPEGTFFFVLQQELEKKEVLGVHFDKERLCGLVLLRNGSIEGPFGALQWKKVK